MWLKVISLDIGHSVLDIGHSIILYFVCLPTQNENEPEMFINIDTVKTASAHEFNKNNIKRRSSDEHTGGR